MYLKGAFLNITSSAFENNQFIPTKYTLDGENINPPLIFEGISNSAKSLVLVVDDPDAPSGTWIHWVLWNINPQTTKIEENSVPNGAIQGRTNRENHYSGPKPPSGTHRYFFRLYAIDSQINLPPESDIEALHRTIKGHIIDQAELTGLYQAKK